MVSSLAMSFDAIMKACVVPHAVLHLDDALSETIRGRGVRAAFAKHRNGLLGQYARWSGAEQGMGKSNASMTLNELMLALKEAKVLDERCTVREVTSFFVMVNADDEIYVADPKGGSANSGATELDFDEFCEVVARICNEKVPEPRPTSLEQTLDTWLGLYFLPALRNAGKGVLLESGTAAKGGKNGSRRPSLAPSVQTASQANSSRRPSMNVL